MGVVEELMECPGKSDLLLALEVLQNFPLFSTNGEVVQADCFKIELHTDDKHFTKK